MCFKVLDLLDKRTSNVPLFLFDTPGQIEAFTWSASGSIITETLAASHPTVIAYVVDSARATNPTTFMSNMLYACSILFRTKLPFFLVFNKVCSARTKQQKMPPTRAQFQNDVIDPKFAIKWMSDFESFQDDVSRLNPSFMGDFTRSLSLVLDQFYEGLRSVSVSARTGDGMEDVLSAIDACRQQYYDEYVPLLAKKTDAKMEEDKKE